MSCHLGSEEMPRQIGCSQSNEEALVTPEPNHQVGPSSRIQVELMEIGPFNSSPMVAQNQNKRKAPPEEPAPHIIKKACKEPEKLSAGPRKSRSVGSSVKKKAQSRRGKSPSETLQMVDEPQTKFQGSDDAIFDSVHMAEEASLIMPPSLP